MTRIISGVAGSLSLRVPPAGTRPTSDRVREALFAALDSADELDGAVVLDGYAGSGALGLEAASRGAARVVLVERSPKAAAICRANAARVADAGAVRAEVVAKSVATYLAGSADSFTLALLDPPYDIREDELTQVLEALAPRLAPDALVVVERGKRSPEPTWPAALTPERDRTWGDTRMWFARAAEPDAERPDSAQSVDRDAASR